MFPNPDPCDPLSDAALIAAAQGGDSQALNCVLACCANVIDRFFRPRIGLHDAKDLRQDVLLAICGSIHRFRSESSFRAFTLGVARYHLLMHLRRKRTGRGRFDASLCSLADIYGEPSYDAGLDGSLDEIMAALDHLPIELRNTIVLSCFCGFGDDEIAVVQDCKPGTVRTRLCRARLLLRERLGEIVEEEDHRGPRCPGLSLPRPSIDERLRWLAMVLAVRAADVTGRREKTWGPAPVRTPTLLSRRRACWSSV